MCEKDQVIMRVVFLVGSLAVSIIMTMADAAAAFVPSDCSMVSRSTSSRSSRLVASSQLMVTSQDEIFAAYQKRLGIVKDEDITIPVVPSLPMETTTIETTTPIVVVDTPPVVIETPPVVVEKVVEPTTTTIGTDPISALWNQITAPFQSMPDPFENMKIPSDLKNVDLTKVDFQQSLKSSIPDFQQSFQNVDFKSTIQDFKNVDLTKSLGNIQLPTPPQRPSAPGIVMPDGARIPTLLEILEKNNIRFDFDLSQWKQQSLSLVGIFQAMRISEFGAWYVAGVCLVAWQLQMANKEGVYREQLHQAEKKAQLAAEAAAVAAQGAALTKRLATSTKQTKNPIKSTETILSESQRQALELEKQVMKKQLETLQAETEALKRQLKEASFSGVNNGVVAEESKLSPPKMVQPVDPKVDERVLEIIKQQDEANAAKAADAANVVVASKKKTTPKKKAAVAPKKKAAPPKKEPVVATLKDETVAVMEKEPVVVVETKEEEDELEHVGTDDIFFANLTAPVVVEEDKPTKTIAASKKAAPKKKTAAKNETTAPVTSDNPWSSLSPSTLKRKTVKELSSYLSERVRVVSCRMCVWIVDHTFLFANV